MDKGLEGQEGAVLCDSEGIKQGFKRVYKCRVCQRRMSAKGCECRDCSYAGYSRAIYQPIFIPRDFKLRQVFKELLGIDEDIDLTEVSLDELL